MKKVMLFSMMMLMALVANAQLKVAPKLEKGVEKTYVTETTMSLPGQGDVKMIVENKYRVADATPDGFLWDVTTTDVKMEAAPDNIVGKLMGAAEEMMLGQTLNVATDKDGKLLKIVNFEELKPKMEQLASELMDKMVKELPQLEAAKDMLGQQIKGSINEEKLVSTFRDATSIMALNGKAIMTGAQEDIVNSDGFKMKRMYFVNGKNITTNSSMNMSKDEMKEMIIKQVEQNAPDQAAMIKENIDQVMESGMLKIDVKEKATYELADDGWVKALKVENTTESMGQSSTTTSVVTLK
jgi:hypothetical protein